MTEIGEPKPEKSSPETYDWSHDLVLGALQNLEEPVGGLVRAFPGRAQVPECPQWIEDWFVGLAERFVDGTGPDPKPIIASAAEDGELSLLAKQPVETPVRVVSIRPVHFRGFRGDTEPIDLLSDLVLIQGRNSSGKTSISEAIEWVVTGNLSRRTSGDYGHAAELADCIANEFRPDDEVTEVELILDVGGAQTSLRRVLTTDYSTTASAKPESDLFVDGDAVSETEERELFDRLLAGVHPILMQHNLRRFVHSPPRERRRYFERLLQIDELTALIAKAVVSDSRLAEIANPEGGAGIAALRDLLRELDDAEDSASKAAVKVLRDMLRSGADDLATELRTCLIAVADTAFPEDVQEASGLAEYRQLIEENQEAERESQLPLLGHLEEARRQPLPSLDTLRQVVAELKQAAEQRHLAREAAEQIADAQLRVAEATTLLAEAGLLDMDASEDQSCPVCEDGSLTPHRISEVGGWAPLAAAVKTASTAYSSAAIKVGHELTHLHETFAAAIPAGVDDDAIQKQLASAEEPITQAAGEALSTGVKLRLSLERLTERLEACRNTFDQQDARHEVIQGAVEELSAEVQFALDEVAEHRKHVASLSEAVGAASRRESSYRLREKWRAAAQMTQEGAEDLGWEQSKAKAAASLKELRTGLIELRNEIVEDARRTFSDEMTKIWELLRNDSGAHFSQLSVPPVKGKGYKLAFELKAVIADSETESEVDALRVFSESQVNVVGIAAYITRAKRLGHKLLILDDPVQSMDEEHFRSFAATLVPALLEDGHQVVILTHSDAFAQLIDDVHHQSLSYTTLKTRPSRRQGCCVDEGNRRISERLKNAGRAAEDGDLDRAWYFVRLAIERMYTLTKVKLDESFESASWRDMSAEDMWNRGVGEHIVEVAPEGTAERLQEILRSSGAGAHDRPASSETDLRAAVKDLKALLGPLRL